MPGWLQGVLFVVCGIPGVVLVLVCLAILLFGVLDPQEVGAWHIAQAVAGVLVGTLASLVGVGKWNRWRYGLVILALPATFIVTMVPLSFVNGSKEWVLVSAVLSIVVAVIATQMTLRYARRHDPAG
jgi:hypothetical protein